MRAMRQRELLQPLQLVPPGDGCPAICVIVPARDESANIAGCVRSLLEQRYPASRLRIIVVDDNSSDDTAAIVASMAARDPRLELARAAPLRVGWQGKVQACCTGVAAAPDADWLCFIDADMRSHPLLLASAVAAAHRGRLDLLSLSPRHDLRSFAERLIIPCGHYLLGFLQDLGRIQNADSKEVVATGQFMLLRRRAYASVGGHAAVASSIREDVELASLLKSSGYRVMLQDGSRLLSTRMYTGWRTLWPGLAKNLSDMLGGPARTLMIAAASIVLAWAAPLLPAYEMARCVNGSGTACVASVPAIAGSAAALAFHIAGAVHFGIPLGYGFIFPVGYTAGAAIALDSLRRKLTHRVSWKGRVYP
jgi:chlorobactene glucosyltransferase